VADQAGCRDHVGGHTVADEENDVLGLALFSEIADEPCGLGLAAIVVAESRGVLARLVEGNTTVGLGGYIYKCLVVGVTSEEI
jgi:hypothetical protein